MKINLVNALILDDNSHVLLTHNCKNGNDRYEFCGGKVNDGETLQDATIRENREELGIEIRIKKEFGDYETHDPREGKFLCRTYFAEIVYGIPRPMEQGKMDWCDYVSYAELERLSKAGTLVPNLVLALPQLKNIVA